MEEFERNERGMKLVWLRRKWGSTFRCLPSLLPSSQTRPCAALFFLFVFAASSSLYRARSLPFLFPFLSFLCVAAPSLFLLSSISSFYFLTSSIHFFSLAMCRLLSCSLLIFSCVLPGYISPPFFFSFYSFFLSFSFNSLFLSSRILQL